jgi:WD40 repeat protein
LAVGNKIGQIQLCDVTTFGASHLPVCSLEWFRNGQHILAGGDDGTTRIWDLSSTQKRKPMLMWDMGMSFDVRHSGKTRMLQTQSEHSWQWQEVMIK